MNLKEHDNYAVFVDDNNVSEHFINVFDKDEIEKYAEIIWPYLISSYKHVPGGFLSATSPHHLAQKNSYA